MLINFYVYFLHDKILENEKNEYKLQMKVSYIFRFS